MVNIINNYGICWIKKNVKIKINDSAIDTVINIINF